jgi:hypothetical protein
MIVIDWRPWLGEEAVSIQLARTRRTDHRVVRAAHVLEIPAWSASIWSFGGVGIGRSERRAGWRSHLAGQEWVAGRQHPARQAIPQRVPDGLVGRVAGQVGPLQRIMDEVEQ